MCGVGSELKELTMPPKRPRESTFPTGRIKKIMQQDEVRLYPCQFCAIFHLGSYICIG